MLSNVSIDAGHSHELQFPNEIIDEVVDYLHDNNEAVKAISLSSRKFLHRARKYLCAAFVLKAPHLIPYYIQVLEIACLTKTAWPKTAKEFSKALGLFQQTLETEIEMFSLRHLYLNNITWSDLSIDIHIIQAAIQRLLGFDMVTFYRSSDVPWTVFKEISPNVTALTLKNLLLARWIRKRMTNGDGEDDVSPLRDSNQAPLTEESGLDRLRIEALYIAHGTLGLDSTIIFAHDSVCPVNVTHVRTFWVHVRSDYWCPWIRHQEFISHVMWAGRWRR
ncbi:hypothetical protein M378DRAFT_17671 [Amanita muscaria Koide BX008]|uniref:Uncharacterized protein n=1 Tax=Amanita muscaria (strain Koide BX008) TaxID=946122 RepID=A0A0C2RZE3_AMAMK|nr:hypothetical protein M378DRAFT_17671 [Amanita muscaria Koide BX008]